MSSLSLFLKQNKVKKENKKFAPTKSLMDENGEALKFEFKHLSTLEDEEIRETCTYEVQVTGKPNLFRPKLNSVKYMARMISMSCVEPNLNSAQLQDSYGVKTPEDLIRELVDDPGEYQDLCKFVQEFNGFNSSLQDKVEEAKN